MSGARRADCAPAAATRVEFRVGLRDALAYCCALLRTATAKGARPVVCASPAAIDELDQRLWTFSPGDFLAHCRVGDSGQRHSPIVLCADGDLTQLSGRDCLINFGPALVPGWQRLPRVIELVADDEAAKAAARQRFRVYRDAGCRPQTLEVADETR